MKGKFARLAGIILTMAMLMTGLMAQAAWAAETAGELGVPEEVYWDEDEPAVACWKKVENAKRYEVVLYEWDGRRVIGSRQTVSSTKVDFKEYVEDGGDYYFAVRAVPTESQEKKGVEAGQWIESEYTTVSGLGETGGRWREYLQGKKYQLEDGGYAAGGWQQILGSWYYFNADGYMQTGWQKVNDVWYYMNADGVMQTGWITLDGKEYFLNDDGSLFTGWKQKMPGDWYYLSADGSMLKDTTVDGYVLDASGKWVS